LKLNKLLACTFAFVMVSSLIFPAYATDERGRPDITNTQQIALSQSDAPVVHQNGNPNFEESDFIDDALIADDFVLSSGFTITDAHFVSELNDDDDVLVEPLFYFIFADNGGQPGAEIASGTAINVQIMDIDPAGPEDGIVEIWFDFEDGVPLDGGVTFWFGLKYADFFSIIDPEPKWIATFNQIGNLAQETNTLTPGPNDWFDGDASGYFFQLTGHDDTVGGEFLPIDSTALLLAAAQSPASWLATLTIAALGIGAYVFTRNPNNMRNIKVILRDYLDRF